MHVSSHENIYKYMIFTVKNVNKDNTTDSVPICIVTIKFLKSLEENIKEEALQTRDTESAFVCLGVFWEKEVGRVLN